MATWHIVSIPDEGKFSLEKNGKLQTFETGELLADEVARESSRVAHSSDEEHTIRFNNDEKEARLDQRLLVLTLQSESSKIRTATMDWRGRVYREEHPTHEDGRDSIAAHWGF